jgi:putative endonuclease
MEKYFYVYILSNKNRNVLYTGITNNLAKRLSEHKNKVNHGFTKKYNVHFLVYYEEYTDVREAIHREKMIKKKPRLRKVALISKTNPDWKDLSLSILSYK